MLIQAAFIKILRVMVSTIIALVYHCLFVVEHHSCSLVEEISQRMKRTMAGGWKDSPILGHPICSIWAEQIMGEIHHLYYDLQEELGYSLLYTSLSLHLTAQDGWHYWRHTSCGRVCHGVLPWCLVMVSCHVLHVHPSAEAIMAASSRSIKPSITKRKGAWMTKKSPRNMMSGRFPA